MFKNTVLKYTTVTNLPLNCLANCIYDWHFDLETLKSSRALHSPSSDLLPCFHSFPLPLLLRQRKYTSQVSLKSLWGSSTPQAIPSPEAVPILSLGRPVLEKQQNFKSRKWNSREELHKVIPLHWRIPKLRNCLLTTPPTNRKGFLGQSLVPHPPGVPSEERENRAQKHQLWRLLPELQVRYQRERSRGVLVMGSRPGPAMTSCLT